MANVVAEYLKKSINPGGTPRRMKEWVGAMLLFQVLATVLPGRGFAYLTTVDSIILSTVVLIIIFCWSVQKDSAQILLSWVVFYVAMLLLPIGALLYGSGKEEMIIISSWSAAMYIFERRYYISFSGFVIAMLSTIVTLASSTVISVLQPGLIAYNTIALICMGTITVVCNCYLLIVDFRHGMHRMDYFERYFDKIEELSTRLSRILRVDKPVEQAMWDVVTECIPVIGIDDFIIYLYDKDKNKLVQVAAYGHKGNEDSKILNPIEIKPGEGIVGNVFIRKKPILVGDTSLYSDYIVDDAFRLSELAVPILIGDEVFGVIDSEHPQKNFYTQTHLQLFNVIAAFCSIKAAQYDVRLQKMETEKNKLEVQKIKELEQFKTRFITNISHDLKTPLSLILGPAGQINNSTKDAFIRKQSDYILKNADHLMTMVEQLLQLNKIEQGIDVIQNDTIELNRVLQDMYVQYTPLAEMEGISFFVKAEDDLLITTDVFKLSQCLHNLLQNAFKYNRRGGEVCVTAGRYSDSKISIVVKDTGIGIAPDKQDKVFERFYKIDVNNHKGTGIGLSLVKEYIQQLSGKVELVSTPGVGSAFTITLPAGIQKQNVDYNEIVQVDVADERQKLILIAEDHHELNEFIVQCLQQEDCRCISAYNGKEALALAQQYLPDLVITDLMMPEMSGEELVTQLKQVDATGHIPIVVLTAKNQVDNRVELYQSGADNYIAKPFKIEELLAVVNNTIAQRKRLMDKFYVDYMSAPIKQHAPTETVEPISEEVSVIGDCLAYIQSHLDDPDLSVNTLGLHLALGRNRLQKEIKTATGLTPVEFIRSVRLHEAHKMLESSSQYNISEIAYMTGFSNLSYFSRSFKVQFGVAPTEVVRRNTV